MELKIPPNVKTIAVTCLQWGDTGKGKIVDLLAGWANVIVRGTGGANAGHSVCIGYKTFVFHLVPSGILHDASGKVNIIGSGAAVDPRILCEELTLLHQQGMTFQNLMVSLNAKLTLPTQIVRDRVGEGSAGAGKIGTTGRGIGPTYGDHVMRVGLTVNDLLNPAILRAKVHANVAFSARILKSYDPAMVKAIICQDYLGGGIYYHAERIFNAGAIVDRYLEYGKLLASYILDTDAYVQNVVGKSNVLLEGAQGALLDVDYGTRPYVTSSNCMVDGLAKGAGLNRSHVDLALGVIKGFYETRVGEGPFVTELGGNVSAEWCHEASKQMEEIDFALTTVNDSNELHQGIALRIAGNEYGATTGRPRRTGWLDLPLLRYVLRWGGPDVVLTKLDVLNSCERIPVCYAYKYIGPSYHYGGQILEPGDELDVAIPAAEVLQCCRPMYRYFPGWRSYLKGITTFEKLPQELKDILNFVVSETGIRPRIISIGKDRNETIFV